MTKFCVLGKIKLDSCNAFFCCLRLVCMSKGYKKEEEN